MQSKAEGAVGQLLPCQLGLKIMAGNGWAGPEAQPSKAPLTRMPQIKDTDQESSKNKNCSSTLLSRLHPARVQQQPARLTPRSTQVKLAHLTNCQIVPQPPNAANRPVSPYPAQPLSKRPNAASKSHWTITVGRPNLLLRQGPLLQLEIQSSKGAQSRACRRHRSWVMGSWQRERAQAAMALLAASEASLC